MNVVLNGAARNVPDTTTIVELVRALGLEGKRIAVERNGDIIPRSLHQQTRLAEGDRLEIVGAVGGG
ncbi:MAG TPA: sulfur carrier protein ThiS [Casimicrobiaceae bacterium]|nr:sulfur carrier protein ThiS [Casimicrobiaceae bacterium]